MLDRDLAELYGVETKRLKEQVRRNIERFPDDFMFELSKSEFTNWRSQFATSNRVKSRLELSGLTFMSSGNMFIAAKQAGVSQTELSRHAYARDMEPRFSDETLAEEIS